MSKEKDFGTFETAILALRCLGSMVGAALRPEDYRGGREYGLHGSLETSSRPLSASYRRTDRGTEYIVMS